MTTIKVKAAPGQMFPMERNVKKYITDDPVDVVSSAYYRRAIADGDLVLVTDPAPEAKATGKGQNGGQDAAQATAPAQENKKDKKAATDE